MALFPGDEMADVTTPDGRTLRVPQSVMQMLQMPGAQTPVAPPPMPIPATTNDVPEPLPDSVTGGALPSENSQVLPPPAMPPVNDSSGSEGQVIGTVDNRPATIDKSNKAYEKQQKAAAAYAASPQGKQDAASAMTNQALENQAQATISAADVDAAGQAMVANAYETRNKDILAKEKVRNDIIASQQMAEEKKAAEVGSWRKKIANTKIDRSLDHPVMLAIAAALTGLGEAMSGKQITSFSLITNAIDRKVAAQEADLDRMAKVYGMTREELADLKENGKRKLEFQNMMIAAESDKAARQIEEIAARTAGEKTKANAKILVAQLQEKAAAHATDAMRWGLDYDQKAQAEKNQNTRFYAGLAQGERFHADEMQVRREGILADMQKALAAERAKGDETAMKFKLEMMGENEKRGIGNVTTGQPLLNQKGIDMLAQADQMDAEAKTLRELDAKSFNPDQRAMAESRAKALEEKASQVRGDAYITGQFRARDPVEARELSKKYGASQSVMTLVDDIKGLYDKEGRRYLYTTEGQAALQSKLGELSVALKDAWQLGAWDKGSATLVKDITGGDPTKGWDVGNIAKNLGVDVGTNPEAFKKKLDSIASGLQTDMYNQLRAAKWDVKDPEKLFSRKTNPSETPETQAVKAIQKDKTPLEREKEAQAKGEGFLSGGAHRLAYHLNKGIFDASAPANPEEDAQRAANSGSLDYPGLSKAQGEQFGKLMQASKGGNPKTTEALLTQAVDSTRPELQLSTLHILRDQAPELYTKARAGIKPESEIGQQLDYEEKNRIAVSDTPVDVLAMQASMPGDNEAFKEMARRASAGDPKAKSMFFEVVKARQRARDPLGISTGGK